MQHKFPIEEVRSQFPALGLTHNSKPVAFFDGPGGSQALKASIQTIYDYMSKGMANLYGDFPTVKHTKHLIQKATADLSTLLNAHNSKIAYGANATTMLFHASRALSRTWQAGDEIILSEIDHHANIDSWKSAAEDKNVTIKYIPFDTNTFALDLDALDELVTPKTKLIAVAAASNAIGTITDLAKVSRAAKKVGALLAVDAVHAVPHFAVDMEALGIDMLFLSAYKFFAAYVGMAAIRKELFDTLMPYKLAPAPNTSPEKLELGTQNHAAIPTISASVDFVSSLGSGSTTYDKILSGYKILEDYENYLANTIRVELGQIPGITLYQANDNIHKTPTIAFRAGSIAPADFCKRMCDEHSIFMSSGNFYASTIAEKLKIDDKGAFIRVGMAPYNTIEEVERFINGVKAIM